jgi:hypothetical protein
VSLTRRKRPSDLYPWAEAARLLSARRYAMA